MLKDNEELKIISDKLEELRVMIAEYNVNAEHRICQAAVFDMYGFDNSKRVLMDTLPEAEYTVTDFNDDYVQHHIDINGAEFWKLCSKENENGQTI